MSGIDVVTTAIVAAVAGSAGRVAAAPLDALSEDLRRRIKDRLGRTREAADAKAGKEPLHVGDRIAFKALGEAALTDDPLIADYLGGVLAASGPNDDSGAAIVALIGRLSSLQLRLHYVIYREIRRLWPDPSLNLYESDKAHQAGVRIPTREIALALGNPPAPARSRPRRRDPADGAAASPSKNCSDLSSRWASACRRRGAPRSPRHATQRSRAALPICCSCQLMGSPAICFAAFASTSSSE